MADPRDQTPALAHREANTSSDAREAELHDGRVRFGPSATLDHRSDALLVGAAVFHVSVELQQLGVGELQKLGVRRMSICIVGEQ